MAALTEGVLGLVTDAELKGLLKSGGKVAVLFGADWCDPSRPVEQVLCELAKKATAQGQSDVTFVKVDAEASAYATKFDVTVVPSVVLASHDAVFAKVEGADLAALLAKVDAFAKDDTVGGDVAKKAALERRLAKLISSAPAMLFMKGTPSEPKCKFSRTVSALLKDANVDFASFDILKDGEVREGLKAFSNWPTYPQFYANGALVGGLDILQEMAADGDLADQLGLKPSPSLEGRLRALLDSAPALLFIKGSPGNERCGFSQTIVGLLEGAKVPFQHFDILQDDEVRQGLKTFSNWPTYPQFYVNGQLIGGLDILLEMAADGDLKSQLFKD